MIKLGDNNTLPLLRLDDKGGWLNVNPYGEAFIPKRQLPANCQAGDDITVFIYLDADLEPVVTTDQPRAKVEQLLKADQWRLIGHTGNNNGSIWIQIVSIIVFPSPKINHCNDSEKYKHGK